MEEIILNDECEDSTHELLKKYDGRNARRIDDIPAMQTVMCLIIAGAVFAANIFYPDIIQPVYEKFRRLISDEHEIMPNLIDLILDKLWK
jgi:hypothetical protein